MFFKRFSGSCTRWQKGDVRVRFPPGPHFGRHLWSRKCCKYHEFWDSSCTKHCKYQCFGKQKSRNFVNTMSFWTRAVQNTANISVFANFPPASSCTKHRHLWSRKCRKYHEFWDSSCTKHRKYQCFCKQKSRKCCKYYEFWDLSCTKHRKYQCFYK